MDTNEHSERILELEKQLKSKQDELDGVLTKHAALQLKNIAGMGGKVEELTSVNEQLAAAKGKMGQIEQKIGNLVALERQLEIQQEKINRLKEENNNLRFQQTNIKESEPKVPQETLTNPSKEPKKTALQRRVEQMHNESLAPDSDDAELVVNKETAQVESDDTDQIVPEIALEKKDHLIEQQEEKNIEHKEIETAQSDKLPSPEEKISPQAFEEIECDKNTNSAKKLSPDENLDTDLLPNDVLKKWLGK